MWEEEEERGGGAKNETPYSTQKAWNTVSVCAHQLKKDLNSIQSPYNFCFPISTLVRVVTLIKANEQMDIETFW